MGDEVTVGRNRPAHVRRQRPNALTATKRQRFLDVLAATANVGRAAQEAGATAGAFYQLRQRDAGFAAAWRQSLEDGYASLEARLLAEALGAADQPAGNAERAGDPAPFDSRLALDVLRRRDAEARAPASYGKKAGYKHVPIGEVERSLIAKLEALERRLEAGGVPPGPGSGTGTGTGSGSGTGTGTGTGTGAGA